MWADVSMKLYPTLPGQRGFSFPLCAERQPRPRVRPRRAWNDRRPSRLATGLFWRELIADRRGGHYRSSCTERILIRFIGDRLRDRPPVKFRCPRTRSRARLRCARSTRSTRSGIEIDQSVSAGTTPAIVHRETDSRSPLYVENHRHAPSSRKSSPLISLFVTSLVDVRYILSPRDQGRLQCGLEAANANDTLGFEHGQRGAPTVSLATSATLHFSNYVYFTRELCELEAC